MATINSLDNSSAPFTVTAGDLTVTAGNLLLTVTNVGGTSGLIKFGAVEFASNFGTNNTFLGGAGNRTLTTANASLNTGVGVGAITQLTTGASNTAVGRNAGNGLMAASQNTCIGASAGFALETGGFGSTNANVCIGQTSGNALSSGSNNVIVGQSAFMNSTVGTGNIVIGQAAGNNYNSGTCSNNLVIGSVGPTPAGNESATIRIGTAATHTKVFIANCYSNFGTFNTFVGAGAGNITLTTGSSIDNTAVGSLTLAGLTTGANNVVMGVSSGQSISTGSNNTIIGFDSAANLLTGSNNVLVGQSAGGNYTGAESSNILINATGTVGESNVMRLGISGSGAGQVNKAFIAGVASVSVSNLNYVTIDTTTGQFGSAATATGSSVLLTSGGNLSSAGVVDYRAPSDNGLSTTESLIQIPIPAACTLSNLYVNVTANASTTDITVTVRKNGVSTAIVATITALTTGAFVDTTHSATFAAGDLISYQISASTVGVVVGSIGLKLVG